MPQLASSHDVMNISGDILLWLVTKKSTKQCLKIENLKRQENRNSNFEQIHLNIKGEKKPNIKHE